ncbi:MAG: hypothetical protein AVDCRST_MAG57-280, partial [uncultured Blastococcus sp.]
AHAGRRAPRRTSRPAGRRHEPARPRAPGGARARGGDARRHSPVGGGHHPRRRRVRDQLRHRPEAGGAARRDERTAPGRRPAADPARGGSMPRRGVGGEGRPGRGRRHRGPLAGIRPRGRRARHGQHAVLPAVRDRGPARRAQPVLPHARRLRRRERGDRAAVRQSRGHRPGRGGARGGPAGGHGAPRRDRSGEGHPDGALQADVGPGLRPAHPDVVAHQPQTAGHRRGPDRDGRAARRL